MKYDNIYQGVAFDIMTELNKAYGPYLKKPKTECFLPEEKPNYNTFIFSDTTLKFKEVLTFDETLEKAKSLFPASLKTLYKESIKIGFHYNTKSQTIFKIFISLTEK